MTADDVAKLFDAVGDSLAPGLTKGARDGLADLARSFRTLGPIGLKDVAALFDQFDQWLGKMPERNPKLLIKFVDDAFNRDKTSNLALILERIRRYKSGDGESFDDLWVSIRQLKATEVTALLKTLGQPAKKKKSDNEEMLRGYLLSPGNGEAKDVSRQVDDAVNEYCSIRSELRQLSVDQVRQRFKSIRRLPLEVLKGVARRLQYEANGSSEELADKLLGFLEREKIGQVRIDHI